ERRHEEGEVLSGFGLAGREGGWLRENRPETAGVLISPPEQHQTERDEQGRFDVQQPANAIDPFVNHQHVDAPEKHEANELSERVSEKVRRGGGRRPACNRWPKYGEDFVNRVAANPGLNSKPAASDERAHKRGNVRAARAERCATKNREGNSVTRAGVRI